jgi:hypothetical protein
LYFFPLQHGQASLRPVMIMSVSCYCGHPCAALSDPSAEVVVPMVALRGLAGLSAGVALVLLIFFPSAHQVLGPVLGHLLAMCREGAGRGPEMARSTYL